MLNVYKSLETTGKEEKQWHSEKVCDILCLNFTQWRGAMSQKLEEI